VGDQVTNAAVSYAEVAEQVRAVLAALAQARDDGRTDDLVACYTEDGVVEVPGLGTFAGASAPREAFAGWAPAVPQHHIVTNTLVTEWDASSAQASSDVVFVQHGASGWAVASVARYHDTFKNAAVPARPGRGRAATPGGAVAGVRLRARGCAAGAGLRGVAMGLPVRRLRTAAREIGKWADLASGIAISG
jgi:ketosteroid isomerase-like protein